jgi:hypothetical protein
VEPYESFNFNNGHCYYAMLQLLVFAQNENLDFDFNVLVERFTTISTYTKIKGPSQHLTLGFNSFGAYHHNESNDVLFLIFCKIVRE